MLGDRWSSAKGPRLLVVLPLAVAACGGSSSGNGADGARPTAAAPASSRLLAPQAFAAAVGEQRRLTVNVHVPFEGDLPGTDLSIPYDQVRAASSRLPEARDTPLAVYCRTGRMSALAVRDLTVLGYTDVVELAGGMQAWQQAGRPVLPSPAAG